MKSKFWLLSATVLLTLAGSHPSAAHNIATLSTSFTIVSHVASAGDNGISLTVGLAEDNGDPSQCGTSTNLSATHDERVNFCYTVTNNSSTTLNFHTLSDDVSGVLFTNMPQTIAPGASFQYNRIVFATTSESPTATWVAVDQLPGYSHSSGTFNFIDITASGTALSMPFLASSVAVAMPFSSTLFGVTSDQLCVNNQGYVQLNPDLSFGSDPCSFGISSNELFPTELRDPARPVYFPFWDGALYTAGKDYYATAGTAPNRQFVVEWAGKDLKTNKLVVPGYTFELVLNEADGSIDFNYLNVVSGTSHDNGAKATVGLQGGDFFSSYSFDSASLNNSQNIHWTPVTPVVFSAYTQVALDVGAPTLSLAPTSLSASAAAGTSTTRTLNIGDAGNRDLHWNIGEAPTASQSFVSAIPGVPAFGQTPRLDIVNTYEFVSFDALNAGTLNSISSQTSVFNAGTFANNDFDVEYVVDNPNNDLYLIDTVSGVPQLVGHTGIDGTVCAVVGIRWDATTGVTYLITNDYNSGSTTLYTIDLTTAEVQLLGTTSGVFIADIAIDRSGVMYGVDTVADMTVTIDKTNGQVLFVGPTGVDVAAEGMDIDASTGVIYFAGFDNNTALAGIYTIDSTSGAATLLSPLGSIGGGMGLDAMAIAVSTSPCAIPSDVPWLLEDPISGTTTPGGSELVTVTFDATNLAAGTYTANLCVNTDVFRRRQVTVPVTFNVTAPITDRVFADGFEGSP